MTDAEAKRIVDILWRTYHPTKRPDGTHTVVWTRKLRALEYEIASLALDAELERSTFLPSIAEFIAAYRREQSSRSERQRIERRDARDSESIELVPLAEMEAWITAKWGDWNRRDTAVAA